MLRRGASRGPPPPASVRALPTGIGSATAPLTWPLKPRAGAAPKERRAPTPAERALFPCVHAGLEAGT